MSRHTHWNHKHAPSSMNNAPLKMFFGMAFTFVLLSFLMKSGVIFFTILLVGLIMIKGAAKMGGAMCSSSSSDEDTDDIETYLKRKNDDLYDESDKRKNDDGITYL